MRSDQQLLGDIRDNIRLAQSFSAGLTLDRFAADIKVFYATIRCLEIISEASRNLDAELKGRHPDIRWSQIAGAGNVYRHDYERISADVIWGTVQNALPPLLDVVLAEFGETG